MNDVDKRCRWSVSHPKDREPGTFLYKIGTAANSREALSEATQFCVEVGFKEARISFSDSVGTIFTFRYTCKSTDVKIRIEAIGEHHQEALH